MGKNNPTMLLVGLTPSRRGVISIKPFLIVTSKDPSIGNVPLIMHYPACKDISKNL
jgi:hypothetical protein